MSDRALRDLAILVTTVDWRMAEPFERGAAERFYLARMKVPRVVSNDGQATNPDTRRALPD